MICKVVGSLKKSADEKMMLAYECLEAFRAHFPPASALPNDDNF